MINLSNLAEVLRAVGPYAGLAGISAVLAIWLFRGVIAKEIFPQLTKEHAYRIIRLVILLTFILCFAGIVTWGYVQQIGISSPTNLNRPSVNQQATASHQLPATPTNEQLTQQRAVHDAHSPITIRKVCNNSFSGGTNNGNVYQACP